jgi:RNA polymerase primary sigma factor
MQALTGSNTTLAALAPLRFPPEERIRRKGEADLIRRAQSGDRQALETLIETHLGLVYKISRRYRCRTYSLDDLVQEGVVGLMTAIERFDGSRGCRLSTYAVHWIRQAIARAVEQNDRLIHVPMHLHTEVKRLTRLREELAQQLGRTPTDDEVGGAAGLPEERVNQLMGVGQEVVSLECGVGADQDASLLDLTEDETVRDPEDDAISCVYRQHLRALLCELRPRERQILEERFGFEDGNPRTLDELSRRLRISRERVRQIETAAIRKLRRALCAAQLD